MTYSYFHSLWDFTMFLGFVPRLSFRSCSLIVIIDHFLWSYWIIPRVMSQSNVLYLYSTWCFKTMFPCLLQFRIPVHVLSNAFFMLVSHLAGFGPHSCLWATFVITPDQLLPHISSKPDSILVSSAVFWVSSCDRAEFFPFPPHP